MKNAALLTTALLLLASPASAQQEWTEPKGGVCLTKEQREALREAVLELKDVHGSPAVVELKEPVQIVVDWDGRVYVNGGSAKPLPMRLTIGKHVDRDLALTLPVQVFHRPKPADPMFRLRIRAQAAVMLPHLVDVIKDGGTVPLDGGVGWDFFHLGPVNAAVHTGVRTSAFTVGLDLTQNFGIFAGPGVAYDGLRFAVDAGVFFAF